MSKFFSKSIFVILRVNLPCSAKKYSSLRSVVFAFRCIAFWKERLKLALSNAAFSNEDKIKNSCFFKKGEKALAKAERKLSKWPKGSKELQKTGKDFCHKEIKKIVDRYQYICIEDLNIKRMMEGSYFAKKHSRRELESVSSIPYL